LDGVAFGQPALALAAKLGSRAGKWGLAIDPPAGNSVAESLFGIAYRAGASGQDPESELRALAIAYAGELAAAERRDRCRWRRS
jgi:XTP/dITP diphosphohydrolase